MKRVALGLLATGGLVLVTGQAASGGNGYSGAPTVVANPASGAPGYNVTVTVEGCIVGEDVDFELVAASASAECASNNTAQVVLVAPATPGSYTGTATLQGIADLPTMQGAVFGFLAPRSAEPERPLDLEFDITVVAPETTAAPTTAAPTTVAPTTAPPTLAPTTTIDDGSGVPVPTTNPTGELPGTGGSGMDARTSIALGLLVVGAGLLVVSQVRRRQPTT